MGRRSADSALLRAVMVWDVRNWARALPFWWPHLATSGAQTALAIGERGGGLSLWLATQGIHVLCTDLGVSFEPARRLHQRYGVSDLVTYAELDATSIHFPDATFDIVIFKSLLGALETKERQSRAISEMRRVLRTLSAHACTSGSGGGSSRGTAGVTSTWIVTAICSTGLRPSSSRHGAFWVSWVGPSRSAMSSPGSTTG
jgi:Methyltransferase domain